MKPRRTTDKACLALFAVMAVGFAVVTVRNINNSRSMAILRPADGDQKPCDDQRSGPQGERYTLVFLDLSKEGADIERSRVCVADCPLADSAAIKCRPTTAVKDCGDLKSYPTMEVAGRYCVPTGQKLAEVFQYSQYGVDSKTILEVVAANYKLIVAMCMLSVVLCLLYSFLMTWFAGLLVFAVFVAALAGLAVQGRVLFYKNATLLQDSEGAEDSLKMQRAAASFKIGAYMVWGFTAFLTLLIIASLKRIRATIETIKTAGQFMKQNKLLILVPLFTVLSALLIVVAVAVSCVAYYSKHHSLLADNSDRQALDLDNQKIQLFIMILFGLWSFSFLASWVNYVVTLAVALWYTSGQDVCWGRTVQAVWWTGRYHLGTVCFGSFVLMVAEVGKAVCLYLINKIPRPTGFEIAHTITTKILMCLVTLAERMIKLFTSQVITRTVVESESFCSAASKVSKPAAVKLASFDFIYSLVLLTGKIFVSASTTLTCYFAMTLEGSDERLVTTTAGKMVTLLIVFSISFALASLFMRLWQSACHALVSLRAMEAQEIANSRPAKLVADPNDSVDGLTESPFVI